MVGSRDSNGGRRFAEGEDLEEDCGGVEDWKYVAMDRSEWRSRFSW